MGKSLLLTWVLSLGATILLNSQTGNLLFDDEYLGRPCGAETNIQSGSRIELLDIQQFHGDTAKYIIPVVFHVIHDNGYENVPRDRILQALATLNERFNLENADTIDVPTPFRAIMGNAKIEFRLARKDPEGNCTTGINRIESKDTYNCTLEIAANNISWNRDNYLNIWIARSPVLGNETFQGFGRFPGGGPKGDGIIMRANSFLINDSWFAHEIGHWFNLAHTWGPTNEANPPNGCSIDDYVEDTPNQKAANWVCPIFPSFSCSGEPNGDNYNNYMNYTRCSRMFTKGQVERMWRSLDGFRHNLWQSENLVATGTDDSSVVDECEGVPIAEFIYDEAVDRRLPCDWTQFYDLSWKSVPTEWQWNFENGEPSFSSEQNPRVRWNGPGFYEVQLVASNAYGSDTITKEVEIFMFPTDFYKDGFIESFEIAKIGKEIHTRNFSKDKSNWSITDKAAIDGRRAAVKVAIPTYGLDSYDRIFLPYTDLRLLDSPKLKFSIAFAKNKVDIEGDFGIVIHRGCNWNNAEVLFEEDFDSSATTDQIYPSGQTFIPDPSEWRDYEIDIPKEFWEEDIFFQFTTFGEDISDFYLDNIRVESSDVATPVSNQFSKHEITLFPNPVKDKTIITSHSNAKGILAVNLLNANGQSIQESLFPNPRIECEINTAGLPNGLYFVVVKTLNGDISHKLLKQ